MFLIFKLAALALCGALFAAFLRPLSPAFGMLTALACGIVLLCAALTQMGSILHTLTGFLSAAGMSGALYLPVCKAVGIAVVVHIAAQVCRDAGESALGSKLELAGVVAATAACLPLMQQVFALLESMLL